MLWETQKSVKPSSSCKACGSPGTCHQVLLLVRVCFNVGGDKFQPFSVSVGLRQVCVLSPFLFIVFVNLIDSYSRV